MSPARALLLLLLVVAGASSCALCRPPPPSYAPFVTARGVRVRDLVVPEAGAVASLGDEVTIEYELRLPDGSVADSSRERGTPATFALGAGRVPPGLEEGILGMRALGRRRLRVPPELGYGSAGLPRRIPANAVLVFDVELLQVRPAAPAEPPAQPARP